jgi:hypothetical protein
MELKISESVLALLMDDIHRLPSDLKFRVQVASCIGSCVDEPILGFLFELDLKNILQQVSRKGFMINLSCSTFRFAHELTTS